MSHEHQLRGALNQDPRAYAKRMDVVLLICAENGGDMDPRLQKAVAFDVESGATELFVACLAEVAGKNLIIVDLGKRFLKKRGGLLKVVD